MDKNAMLREYNEASFSAWEANLFLDTHPFNAEAIAFHHHYTNLAAEKKKQYEAAFGPLTSNSAKDNRCHEWIAGPWPWE